MALTVIFVLSIRLMYNYMYYTECTSIILLRFRMCRQRFFYWETERGRVSWFPPQHPRAVLTMPSTSAQPQTATRPEDAAATATASSKAVGGDKRSVSSPGRKSVGFGGVAVADEDDDEPPAKKDRAARLAGLSVLYTDILVTLHKHTCVIRLRACDL